MRRLDRSAVQPPYTTTNPQLAPPLDPSFAGFTDRATDQPANAANTFTYTLNLTQCLASLGVSWSSGQEVDLDFGATGSRPGAADGAWQDVSFRRQ
jgi:hypothetical protein